MAFITNMQQASVVNGETTARALVEKWIEERNLGTDADTFFANHTLSNISTNNPVQSLDDSVAADATLSVYTKAVATGGVKGAC